MQTKVLSMEIEKLFRKKSTRVLVLLYMLFLVGLSLLYFIGEWRLGVSLFNAGQFLKVSLNSTMALLLPFMALFISGNSFSEEFSFGTIHNMLLLPISRSRLFWGKLLAVMAFLGVLLGGHLMFSALISIMMDGFFSWSVFGSVLLSYGGAWIALGLVSLLGAAVSLWLLSSGLMVVVSFLGYGLIAAVGIYYPRLQQVSPTTLISGYGSLLTQLNIGQLLVVASYYIMVSMIGLFLFEKRVGSANWESL